MAWAPDYTDLTTLKDYLKITNDDSDTLLSVFIAAASRAIDDHCSGAVARQFGIVDAPESREYTPRWSTFYDTWVIDTDDIADLTGVLIDVKDRPGVVTVEWEPVNAVKTGKVFEQMLITRDSAVQPVGYRNEVVVTAKWGWPTIPAQVVNALFLAANRLSKRRVAPFGVAGSPQQGSEMRLLAKIDADAELLLRKLRRPGPVA